MVDLGALWLPILLSAVIVWLASFFVWTVLPYHRPDRRPRPREDGGEAALSTGNQLILIFVFHVGVGVAVAYVTGRVLGPGTEYLQVHRVAGTVAFLAHGAGVVPEAIWFGRPWGVVVRQLVDALIYGTLTGGVFGWLWPS